MATLLPPITELAPDTPNSEILVLKALEKALPSLWTIFHSVSYIYKNQQFSIWNLHCKSLNYSSYYLQKCSIWLTPFA